MYSSPTDVRNALTPGGLSSDTTTAAGFQDVQIEDAIKEADGVIDTFISAKYGIPTDPGDPTVAVYPVRAWSRDIAAWLVTLTFRKSKDLTEDDPIRLRQQWVMGVLEKIAAGDLTPNLPQPPTPADGYGPQGAFVYNQYPFKLFTAADVWPLGAYSYVQPHRYGDMHWQYILVGSGYDEVLVLYDGQPIPAGTPDNVLVVYIPGGP